MIHKYNNFIDDSILENIINESILYLSPKIKDILNSTDSLIAKNILDLEKTDIAPDMTFVDISKDGYLSFTTMRNAKNILSNQFVWGNNIDKELLGNHTIYALYNNDSYNDVFKKSRNDVALGRFVNRCFPNKFSSKDIEDFVNKFKANIENSKEKFLEVSGNDIAIWYDHKKYKSMNGTLGNSCMAKKSDLFEIYTDNDDVCKLLILVENDMLIGRALVWKLEVVIGDAEYFMDRQYTIKDSDVEKFRNYAKEKGWIYKANNNHHDMTGVIIDGKEKHINMTVKVNDLDYDLYPYMDTFKRYNPNTGILYNDANTSSENDGCYILNSTDGGYEVIESGYWSEWYGERIPEDQAVYSDYEDDYIYRDRAVNITRGDRSHRGWYPITHPHIVRCIDDNFCHEGDCIYSDLLKDHIFEYDAVEVVTEIYKNGRIDSDYIPNNYEEAIYLKDYRDLYWYKQMQWQSDAILKNIMTKDSNGNWIPKIFELNVYMTESGDYLSKIDAIILEQEIDKLNKKIVDSISYDKSIKKLIPDIKNKGNALIKEYDNIINGKGQQRLKFDKESDEEYINTITKVKTSIDNRLKRLNDFFNINES